jgi:diguanylate cyclase (GGDEF)-like protein/PAS domain S-box-containing protein
MPAQQPPLDMAALSTVAEETRLRALAALGVMDSSSEPLFDDLALLASQLCDAPIALISLVDDKRQWFKARCGLDASETPREFAFCAHALTAPDILEVQDALVDPRFADNPLVLGTPGIRFYAGAPLLGRNGQIYGSLCVIDTVARTLSQRQHEGLSRLSRQVVNQLETRADRQKAQLQASTLSRLLEAMPDAVVSCGADGLLSLFNETARQWHGTDPRELAPAQCAEHFELFESTGNHRLATESIPLIRAWRGQTVRDFELVIKARSQPPRAVRCNAEPLVGADGAALGAVCVMHDVTSDREISNSMAESNARLERALDGAELGLWELRVDEMTLQVDARGSAMLGLGSQAMIKSAKEWTGLLHPADQTANSAAFERHLRGAASTYESEFRVMRAGDEPIWLFSKGKITHRDPTGLPTRVIGTFMDISERKRKDLELARAAQLLRQSGHMAKVGGWTLDLASGQATWTDQVYRIHDLDPAHRPDLSTALRFYTASSRPLITAAVERCIQDGTPWDLELEIISEKGRHVWVRVQGEPIYDDSRIVRLGGAFQDVTERKQSEIQMQRLNTTLAELSYTDALTGLGNRRLFDETLALEWARASRKESWLALLMIDVDYFKRYNDLHGHPAGDSCLQNIAKILKDTLPRVHEQAMRYGGEEFAVLLPDTDRCGAEVVALRMLDALGLAALPHGASPAGPHVTLSVGVAYVIPCSPLSAGDLLRRADEALYQAKGDGRARMVSLPLKPELDENAHTSNQKH